MDHVYIRNTDKLLSEQGAEWLAKSERNPRTRFILKNHQCPGDILMLSALVRDIKRWTPHVEIDIRTSCNAVFDNNPYITPLDENDPSVCVLDMHYEIIHECNQNRHRHFIHGFVKDFNEQAGASIKLTEFKPDIHLSEKERDTPVFPDQPEKFILMNAGGKTDYLTKWWWPEAWEKVVAECPNIKFLQIGKSDKKDSGSGKAEHTVIPGDNVINQLEKTTIREVMRLVYQSVGTLSVVTSIMHMAATWGRHAAVIAGGHEPWWWEKYPGHDYFHSIGEFDCCRLGGCWKKDCENKNEQNRQKCLELIDPKDVATAIKKWFDE